MSGGKGGVGSRRSGLTALESAVGSFCQLPSQDLSAGELAEELIRLRHICDLLELEFSESAARFAATDEYEAQGSVSPVDWIRPQCKMGGYAASERVCVGEEMERLPHSLEALCEGRIGFAHLALMARTSSALHTSATTRDFDETGLLASATEFSVGRLCTVCSPPRHAGDPAGYAAGEARSVEDRVLELNSGQDGFVYIKGLLDSAGDAVLRTALEPLAQKAGPSDDRPHDRRMADALVELAHHGLNSGVIPQRASQRPHLQVTASLETLLCRPGASAAELEFSLPISARMVERLACDASVTRVLFGPDSAIVDVGRAHRVVPGAPLKALTVLHKCCQWPGGDRPASWSEAHHLTHWSRGGRTNLNNLVLLCTRHHWMVHEGGWQITRDPTGRIVTIPPVDYLNRHLYPRGPDARV